MDQGFPANDYAAYLRSKRSVISVVLAKYQQRSVRIPDTLFCFLEGAIDYVAYRGPIDRQLPNAKPYPIVCEGKEGVLAAFGRLVAESGEGLTNCLFFVDRDFDEYSGGANPSDWRVFVTAGYSFESDYAFGPSIRVLAQNVMAVHWDSHEVGVCEQRYSEALNEFSVALTPLLGVAVYCQSEGCRITFDNTGLEQLFEFDDEGQPTRKKKALETFLTRSLESGSIPSIWAARTFVRKLRAAKCKASIRGKYALAFLRIYVHRLMQSLRAAGVEFVQVDTGNRFLAQILAQHIELQGLREFLLTARGRLSCPC